MEEILKKINEEINAPIDINSGRAKDKSLDIGYWYGLEKAKEIILSQQKEQCESLKSVIERHNTQLKEWHEGNPVLSKPLTIGDKIRESNESLADEIHNRIICGDLAEAITDFQ